MASTAARTRGAQIREMKVPADEGQLGRVRDFIVEVCGEAGLGPREISNTKLAVDEACTNIIKHAYGDDRATGDITVTVEVMPGEVTITLKDRGQRFDFSSVEDPDLDQYVETGRKGGLGVFLINRLMDDVHYESSAAGNELTITKRAQSSLSGLGIAGERPFRSTLRFKFTLRAGAGLFLLMAVLWGVVFVRQSNDIKSQRAGRWVENRRLAENLANRSVDLLMTPDEYSLEKTTMTSYLGKQVAASPELAYVRVVDANGQIVSSGNLDELFTPYQEPVGDVLLNDAGRMVWTRTSLDGREVRDISVAVRVTNPESGQAVRLGYVHAGVFADAIEASIEDTRWMTTLLLISIFLVGILLIIGLVQVFVRPIQLLTDGVRAIGDGNLEGKLDVQGPAEIGAIAAVFNEITDKFKVAQNSILEQEKMHKEMEVAKEIQHSLLPRHRPEVSGYDIAPLYQAAAEVGGDYYDFVQVDEDTIGVVVADVSGKGVPGSLVMTMIRTALRMEARGNKNASDVMAKMNAFVTDDMKKGMFVTMFYVILDSKNRIISYASAGHNPMVLFRAETNETYFLNPKGFPVGISLPDEELFRKSITLEKIKLKKDDMLLIYTDGVTEAMNAKREQYGEDRMLAAIKRWGKLSPEEFIDKLDGDIKKFTAGHPQNDDITVVAVKEKLQADDVLFGIRKKLIDLVDVKGMSVREACAQMRVSPATYYRYKKRLETLGERGLKNKVLRKDITINRLSLEARKEILAIMASNPDFGPKRLADEYNATRPVEMHASERMVYEEFKRMGLNTRELRIEYLKRHGIIEGDDDDTAGVEGEVRHRASRELVEDLLKDIPGVELTPPGRPAAPVPAAGQTPRARRDDLDDILDSEGEGVGMSTYERDDVTELRLEGHIDSVTSSELEKQIKRMIDDGARKIIVNLSEVSYISSGGWGIFTGEVRHLRESGGDVVLVGMTPEVYDVYELLGFADVIGAFTGSEEARAFLARTPEERYATPSQPDRPVPAAGEAPAMPSIEEELPGEGYVPEWESLKIEATTVGESGDIVVLSLRGIIDTVSAENLRGALGRVIKQGINKVVVDMSGVEYVSSGGWGTFTERLRELRRDGGDIKLFGMDPDVHYVFTMLGFNIVLSSFDVLTHAIEGFKRPAPATVSDMEGEPTATEPAQDREPAEREYDRPTLERTPPPLEYTAEPAEPAPSDQSGRTRPYDTSWLGDHDSDDGAEPDQPAVDDVVVFDDEPAAEAPVEEETVSFVDDGPAAEAPVEEETVSFVEDDPDDDEPVAEAPAEEETVAFVDDAPAIEDMPEAPLDETPAERALTSAPPVEPVPAAGRRAPAELVGLSKQNVEGVVDWENTEDGIVLARLHGSIEAAAEESLGRAMQGVLALEPAGIILDYRDVPYVSGSAWAQIAACSDACRAWGGIATLFGLNPDLFDIFDRLELRPLVVAHGSEAESLRAVRAAVAALPPRGAGKADAHFPVGPVPIAYERTADDTVATDPGGAGAAIETESMPRDEVDVEEPAYDAVADLGAEPLEPVSDAAEPTGAEEAPTPDERPGIDSWRGFDEGDDNPVEAQPSPLDNPVDGDHVDVQSARTDKNLGRDKKIRDMGWGEYGQRLRRARERDSKAEDDD